jgi:hypothetical protein
MLNIRAERITTLLIASLIFFSHGMYATQLTQSQMRKYVSHIIDMLFIPPHHSGSYANGLKNFTQQLTETLEQRLARYASMWSFTKSYVDTDVEKAVIEESLNFITRTSVEYANDIASKLYLPATVSKQIITQKTINLISAHVAKLYGQAHYLEHGVFTYYYGVPLYNKIEELYKQELQRELAYAQQPKPTQYPTTECPVCYEDFGKSVKQLFLKCGHAICHRCLESCYHAQKEKLTCPLCRAAIAIGDFAQQLWQPSAPAWGV